MIQFFRTASERSRPGFAAARLRLVPKPCILDATNALHPCDDHTQFDPRNNVLAGLVELVQLEVLGGPSQHQLAKRGDAG